MSLPKIEHPLFKITIPSTKKTVMARPMLVKEEKILLMAKQGADPAEQLIAIKQVVNNCLQGINVEELATFDMEYIFLKLRALSVDNKVKIGYIDEDDGKEREFEINLDEIEITVDDKLEKIVSLGDDTGLELGYPLVKVYESLKGVDTAEEMIELLAIACLKKFYKGEQVWDLNAERPEKVREFVEENLPIAAYNKIKEFMGAMPNLKYDIKYTNDNGEEKVINLSSVNDFFLY